MSLHRSSSTDVAAVELADVNGAASFSSPSLLSASASESSVGESGKRGRLRTWARSMDSRLVIGLFTAIVNMVVIILIIALVSPYKTELAVMQQKLVDLQESLRIVDYMQTVNNISRISGMADLVQSQVLSLSSQSGAVHDAVADSTRQIDVLNSTIARISRLVDLNVGFNGTVGNCILNYVASCPSGWCSGEIPLLSSNLTVVNPTVRINFMCRWEGTTWSTFTIFSPGQGSLLTFQIQQVDWDASGRNVIATANQTNTGVYSLANIVLSFNSNAALVCPNFCVSVQY